MFHCLGRGLQIATLTLSLAACTTEAVNDDSPSASAEPDPDSLPANAPFPTVSYHDGPVLTAPAVVLVTFAGDALAEPLADLGTGIASSAWWDEVRAGYCQGGGSPCIGVGPAGTHVALSEAAAASYSDSTQGGASTVKDWLTGALADGRLPAPEPGSPSNTLYMLHFPLSTTLTLNDYTSCVQGSFAGYHERLKLASGTVSYGVIMDCPLTTPSLTQLESATLIFSHELIEAATDPAQTSYFVDWGNSYSEGWIATFGGEVADLCLDMLGENQDVALSGSYWLQRSWSSARAQQRRDPCVPVPAGSRYFNGSPRKATFGLGLGESADFDVDMFSDPPGQSWSLLGFDASDLASSYLDISFTAQDGSKASSLQVSDGQKVRATVKLKKDPAALPLQGATGWLVSFASGSATLAGHVWPIFVEKQ